MKKESFDDFKISSPLDNAIIDKFSNYYDTEYLYIAIIRIKILPR